ncbi:hypothetical protein ACFQ2B_02205 [Streptomyces stramineus]
MAHQGDDDGGGQPPARRRPRGGGPAVPPPLERARSSGQVRNETECLFRLSEALLATGDAEPAVEAARGALAAPGWPRNRC